MVYVAQILISLLVFSAVGLLVWSVFRIQAVSEPTAAQRLARAMGTAPRKTVFELSLIGPFMTAVAQWAQRFPLFRQRVRRDLEAAGNPSRYSVDEYLAICFLWAATLLIVATLLIGRLGRLDFVTIIVLPLLGFAVPLWVLREAAQKRIRAISKQLPYTLDLIALMMGAGGSFTESIDTIVQDDPTDQFNQELRLVAAEIELGANRATALQNLAERIPLDSLRSVVGAVNQAEALGTPLASILTNQAAMLRMRRSVRAEEASATASLRILAPTVLILAASVLVMLGPDVIMWIARRQGGW